MALYFKDNRGWHEIYMWRRDGLIAQESVPVPEADVPEAVRAAHAEHPDRDGPLDGRGWRHAWRETADQYKWAKNTPPPGYTEPSRQRDAW